MAEDALQKRKYEYHVMSNLVIEADRDKRRAREPTGEAESLWGKMGSTKMGDRVGTGKQSDLEAKLKKSREKRSRAEEKAVRQKKMRGSNAGSVFVTGKGATVLSETAELDTGAYRPTTRETAEAYDALLTFIQKKIGDVPADVLDGAAAELLHIVKTDDYREPKKHEEAKGILGSKLSNEAFNQLMNIGKRINDYTSSKDAADDTIDVDADKLGEDEGVAVVIGSEDEGDQSDELDEIRSGSESDDDDATGVDTELNPELSARARGGGRGAGAGGDSDDEAGTDELDVSKIDAYWLQRQLSTFYDDATVSHKMAEDVIGILQNPDLMQVEGELLDLLEYDKFTFVKMLLTNRAKIAYVTRLRQAQTDDERKAIESEMAADVEGGGAAILEALQRKRSAKNWAEDRTGEFQAKVRREARELQRMDADGGATESKGTEDEDGMEGIESSDAGPKPDGVVDLDTLAFAEGGRLMSNKRCELPDEWGCTRVTKPGYEEVHVPPLKSLPTEGERLIKISELPKWAHPAFPPPMTSLNRIQSRVKSCALDTSENMLLCAPTGAGKTNVAVMTILREIGKHINPDTGKVDTSKFKVVYVAPMKALVQEVVGSFTQRLTEAFGVQVRELTGDQNLTKQQISDTQVIVTTPEKWDIITRKSGDRTYTQLVRLVIIDEVHLLHDERGPVLEAIVARTIRQIEATQDMVRLVGLSATLPNYVDVASFLRVDAKKGLFFFDNAFRPCPLQQQYIGVTEKKALKRFQLMNQICYEKICEQRRDKNQVIVFVHSRKDTAKTARALAELARDADELDEFVTDASTREILMEESETTKNEDLVELLPLGFGIHHAGMSRIDRTTVEDLFSGGHIQVLVCTATLAWGVNLPAHCVIIKGTQVYDPEKGRWVELSPLDVCQMLGRAGRVAFDTFGEGIVLTSHSELQYYLSLMNVQLPIESQMIKRLADILNAEIVLGNIANVRDAAAWMGYTYLYVRMLRNPSLYGISELELARDSKLLQRRLNLAHSAAVLLDRHSLVKYDRRTGAFQSTALGRVASHYYIAHPSIATYNEFLKPSMTNIELFRLFALSNEFRNVVVRNEEKEELRKLLGKVPIPIKETAEEPSAKVNVLLQAYISQLRMEGMALSADMVYVQQSAGRILRAIFEICLRRGWAALAQRSLTLCKLIDRRMWTSQSPLRQFAGVRSDVLRKLEAASIPWVRYYDMKPADIGALLRNPKMSKPVHRLIHAFPKLDVQANVQPITQTLLKVELVLAPDFVMDPKVHGTAMTFWIMVEDVDGEELLHYEPFVLKARYSGDESAVTFTVPIFDPLPPQYYIRVVSDRWIHAETLLPISFRHLILPDKSRPFTELLDLNPLPKTHLKDDHLISLYPNISTFNPIQTQVFGEAFTSDKSLMVAAPAGSGKTIIAELAMFRAWSKDANARVVYLAPKPELAAQRFADWSARLGTTLGKVVVELTGETAADLKLLDRAHVAIATPEQWDMMSRRWRKRPAVKAVRLLIADELHLIGGAEGPTLEVCVSRTRYMAEQTDTKIRIVGLSASVANAHDLGAWIGAPDSANFCFAPENRPVPLDVTVQSFEIARPASRLLAMARPVYGVTTAVSSVNEDDPDATTNPTIVFVPSRRQAQLTAIDLCTYAAADGKPEGFVAPRSKDVLAKAAADLTDAALAHGVERGIAFLHEGTPSTVRSVVRGLFAEGHLRVVVATASSCWGVSLKATQVVIMDTARFDGRERRSVDYPSTDLLQMMGLAGRPGVDLGCRAVVLCHASRKEYIKRVIRAPLPVESHLDHVLHDHMSAEVVTKTIETKQDAVDNLTWTFLYRRLAKNPNYYGLQGKTGEHIADHLSELVENTLTDLEASRCVGVEDDMDVVPLNLGMIAAYYYVKYTTLEVFASSLTPRTKLKGILEILCAASEFEELPLRHGEEHRLRDMARHLPLGLPKTAQYTDVATKANILLQAHFSRKRLPGDLRSDLESIVLSKAVLLLQAMVDVISSAGWLKPALAVMELSQMIVQGLWADRDSPLLQIPHFTRSIVERCAAYKPESGGGGGGGDDSDEEEDESIEGVFDIAELPDDVRHSLLGLKPAQYSDVARFCNRYPNIAMEYKVQEADEVTTGDPVRVEVQLEREASTEGMDEGAGLGAVHAPLYPKAKSEGWWVVIGDPADNKLLAIKRIALTRKARSRLEFAAPDSAGEYNFQVFLMSDSYLGCDQEYDLELNVAEGESGDSDDSDDDSDEA